MIPKETTEPLPRNEYKKPLEHSLPNQISHPEKEPGQNIYQIDENEISNSIDINYEINMDINNPGMHFSNINFENIDRKMALNKNEPAI